MKKIMKKCINRTLKAFQFLLNRKSPKKEEKVKVAIVKDQKAVVSYILAPSYNFTFLVNNNECLQKAVIFDTLPKELPKEAIVINKQLTMYRKLLVNTEETVNEVPIHTSSIVLDETVNTNLYPNDMSKSPDFIIQKNEDDKHTVISLQDKGNFTCILTFTERKLTSFYLNTVKNIDNVIYPYHEIHEEGIWGTEEEANGCEKNVRVWLKRGEIMNLLLITDTHIFLMDYSSRGNTLNYAENDGTRESDLVQHGFQKVSSGEVMESKAKELANIDVKKIINGSSTTITISDACNTLDTFMFEGDTLVSFHVTISGNLLISDTTMEQFQQLKK